MALGLWQLPGHDLRLYHAIALNVMVLFCAWRFVRARSGGDGFAVAPWAVLLWLLVQYLSVSIAALLCVLNAGTMSGIAAVLCAMLYAASRRQRPVQIDGRNEKRKDKERASAKPVQAQGAVDQYVAWAAMLLGLGYLASMLWDQRMVPPMGDDGLTYHLPAAVRWLQHGRFVRNEVWFLNPAATYNALLGSTLLAWWMAPLGNDFLAKYVQAPGLLLVFVALLQLCRLAGARLGLASLIALAAIASRPFISQIFVVKDDLYLSGFFLMVVLALAEMYACSGRMLGGQSMQALKLGISVGMFLATKVTSLMALPMLLLGIDAPFRAGWKRKLWALAGATALALAGPWYAYNLWKTGNPLYPADISIGGVHVLKGLFRMQRSLELGTFRGVLHVVCGSYFSMAAWMLIALLGAWLAAAVVRCREVARAPLQRVSVFGPPLGAAIYLAMCQFPEVRYLDPVFALLFVVCGLLGGKLDAKSAPVATALGAVFAAASLVTGFSGLAALPFLLKGFWLMVIGVAFVWARNRWPQIAGRILAYGAPVLGIALLMAIWVYQNAAIARYAQARDELWQPAASYGGLGEAWALARSEAGRGKTIAYTNTCLIYPLFGFDWNHDVVYAPLRRGLKRLTDLPRPLAAVPGERMVELIVAPLMDDPDPEGWLANLKRAGADYLFLAKETRGVKAAELQFAQRDPQRFRKLFENAAAVMYEIRW